MCVCERGGGRDFHIAKEAGGFPFTNFISLSSFTHATRGTQTRRSVLYPVRAHMRDEQIKLKADSP